MKARNWRIPAALAVLAAAVGGCSLGGNDPVAAICDARPAMDRAISSAQAPGDYKQELLDDSEEFAADEGHCPDAEGEDE
jgi:hypothetical protein